MKALGMKTSPSFSSEHLDVLSWKEHLAWRLHWWLSARVMHRICSGERQQPSHRSRTYLNHYSSSTLHFGDIYSIKETMSTSPHQLFLLADHIKLSLLERQRAQSLKLSANSTNDGPLTRSLESLRAGIETLTSNAEEQESTGEEYVLLR